jgi:hypothetical protein
MEGKWTIIRNSKANIRDRDQKYKINRNLGHYGSSLETIMDFYGEKGPC